MGPQAHLSNKKKKKHPPLPLLQPILTIHLLADPHLHDVPQQTHSYVDVFKMLI